MENFGHVAKFSANNHNYLFFHFLMAEKNLASHECEECVAIFIKFWLFYLR